MDLRPLKRSKRIKAANKSRSDCQDLASSSAAPSPRSAQAALLQSSFSENKGAGRKRKELHEPSRASPSKRPRRNCDELGAPKYNLRSMATCATKDYTERDMEREEGTVTVDEGLTDGDLKTHGRRGRSKKLVMDGSSRRTKHTLGPEIEDPCGSGPEAEVERKERQGYRVISEVGEDFHDECSQEDDEGLSDSSQNGGNNIADPNPEDFDEGENDEDDEDDDEEEEEEEEEDFDGGELTNSGFPGTLRALTGMMSGASSRFRAFLNNLRQTDDPTIQLITLQELSEMLLVSNEDALSTFLPAEAFVLVLVKLMQPNAYGEENPDVMLLACRCLANLMEVMPSAMPSVVYGGAVSVLCQKLLEIQFIDVAEQALSTLEKISVEFPSSVIREGGLGACLNFLDFFSTSVQRVAITTAANSCRTIPMDCFPAVRDAIPVLQNVISGNDQKVVEQGCICVARIVENFRHHPQNLEQLMSEGLLGRIVSLLLPGPTSLISPHTYTQFVRVLALVAKASPKLSAELLKLHVVDNVYQILTGISPPGENGQFTQSNGILVMQTLSHRPKDQIYEALNVACELLPALPKSGVFDVGASSSEVSISKRAKRHAAMKRKFEALASCQNELVEFATLLLPVLTGVYLSTVNLVVRQKVLSICIRILAGLQARLLSGALHSTNITSFLATILSQNDHSSLNVAALQLADVLRRRFPKHFVQAFEREGLVAEIEKLTNRPNASEDSKKAAKVKLVSDDLDSASQFSDDLPASSIASASPISSAMSHSTVIANSPDTDLQGWLQRTAQSFLSSFDVQKKEMKAPDSSRILKDLKKFSTSLSCSSNIEDDLKDFSQFLVRDGQDSISSHELLNSGIIDSMLDLLGSPNDIKRTARAAFLKTFLLQTDASPFVFLVQKLQELLSKLEHFEVVTVHPTYSESGRSSIASMLAKQMRLKLIAADEATVPRAYKNIMVSIHAIATFKSLEDYLRPRLVQPAGFTASLRRAVAENGALSTAFSAFSNASQHSPFELVDDEGEQSDQPAKGDSAPAAGTRSKRGLEKNGDAVRGSEGRDKTAENVLEVMDEKAYSDPEDMSELLQDLHDHHEAEVEDPTAVSPIPKDGKLTAKTDDGRRVFTPTTQNTPTSSQASSSKTAKSTSYADALRSTPQDWHVEFSIGNQVIDNESTIYGAIHKSDLHAEQQDLQRNMWASVYPVRFRKAEGPPPSSSTQNTPVTFNDAPSSFGDTDSTVGKLLRLLDTLYAINAHPEDILFEERDIISAQHSRVFVNNKLTAKLNRQLEEPLIVASCSLPQWCEDLVRFYPFLFPFESRHLFLQSTSFGYSRSMWRWQNTHSGEASSRRDELRPSLGRLIRQKVRIARGRMLESGIKVMELYGCSPSVLEVEYFEEVGSGLGPTLEFYSSVSLEFAKRDLHIWRDHDLTDGSYISSAGGLFPAPMDPRTADSSNAKRVLRLFKVLGQFVARSMLDGRIIDIRFNPVFFRIAEAQDCVAPSLGTVSVIDPDLAKSLNLLQRFQLAKEKAENEGGNGSSVDAIEIDGCKIDDVSLDFTLPGCPHIDLIEHGAEKSVTIHNVAEYISLVIEWTMKRGVELQINAFREGFSLVFPFTALHAFFPDELVILFGKVDEDWSFQTLTDCIKADHGFNMDSDSVQNLLSVLHAFDEGERRSFLQFATGSPKLPIGGFKNLTPRLTVVCKPSEAPLVADDYLPSVMTCVNYLKLPDYSSRAVLRARLRKAFVEGQGAFHLS